MLPYHSLLLLAASLASATCYNGGVEGNSTQAINNLPQVCGLLQGTYITHSSRIQCINDGAQHWKIEVTNSDDESQYTLTASTCIKQLSASINGCLKPKHPGMGGVMTDFTNNIDYKYDFITLKFDIQTG